MTSASIAAMSAAVSGSRMAEIEAQPVGRDQRALLRHVLAEAMPQRLVQQMGDRMVGAQPAAALAVDAQLDRVADLERGRAASCRGAGAARRPASGCRAPPIRRRSAEKIAPVSPTWPPGFGVERRLVDDEADLVAGLRRVDPLLALDDRQHDRFGRLGLVAEKLGRRRPPRASAYQVASVAASPEPTQDARERARACSISRSNLATSTAMPRGRRMSCVRSSGKP